MWTADGRQPSSGGNQSLTEPGGWTIHTNAPEPFSPYGLGGTFKGEPPWSYPSAWPGLHASHLHVTLATHKTGNFEISAPLTALHWQPKPGETYRADLGVLSGANGQTTQRVYRTNKATAGVPSEAELAPKLWGKWRIVVDSIGR